MKKGNISIFVPHIGCPNKCSFCNQNTITGQTKAPTPQTVVNIIEKALERKDEFEFEVGFFGGSFTAIDRDYMISLLEAAKPYVESGAVSGIRCSTRPDFIDDEVLTLLKSYGTTTIEIGAQSMDDGVLLKNMRGHTAKDVRNAAELIKKYKIDLGIQMMTDLYGSSLKKDRHTAREIIKLKPEMVRIYPTVVLKNTYLAKLYEEGKYTCTPLKTTVALCAQLVAMFEEKGIKVIRLGLHASKDIKKNMLAGGYHDSFGLLVQSRIMADKIKKYPRGKYDVYVNKKSESTLLGVSRENIMMLEEAGYDLNIIIDDSLEKNELRLI